MEKRNLSIIIAAILVVSLFPLASAGFFDFLKKSPTGKATDANVNVNVSVTSGAPVIYDVTPAAALTLTVGPNPTYFHVNFSVNDSDGAANLVNTSAYANVSLAGEAARNTTCSIINYGGYHANFSCLITMWWFDGNGDWEIGVNISDQNGNTASNATYAFCY